MGRLEKTQSWGNEETTMMQQLNLKDFNLPIKKEKKQFHFDKKSVIKININPLAEFFKKHGDKFWWFHSFYALLFGVGVMWLGSRNFSYIRLAIFQLGFIWITSLILPFLHRIQKIPPQWKHRFRLLVNYFNRNFYQQILFFVLPIYYQSTTLNSKNFIFILLIAVSAVLSTLDIVYDRFISIKGMVISLFFAFNLFLSINVMLPILWNIRHIHATRISALLAFMGFSTFCFRLLNVKVWKKWLIVCCSALMMLVISEWGRPFIPPAPLKLIDFQFGTAINRATLTIQEPVADLPAGFSGKIYVMTSVYAPVGLSDRIHHSWYLNGKKIYQSKFFDFIGGKKTGFRMWTFFTLKNIPPNSTLGVDVETQAGQPIGRSYIPH